MDADFLKSFETNSKCISVFIHVTFLFLRRVKLVQIPVQIPIIACAISGQIPMATIQCYSAMNSVSILFCTNSVQIFCQKCFIHICLSTNSVIPCEAQLNSYSMQTFRVYFYFILFMNFHLSLYSAYPLMQYGGIIIVMI